MPDSFRVWKNDYKQNDKHPDYKASNVEIGGEEYDIAVWESETKKGEPCLSVVLSPPYKSKEERSGAKPEAAPSVADDDEELPF